MPYPRSNKKAVLDRIKCLEEAIAKGNEYLKSGQHANWRGFRPLFTSKIRNGKELPPHRDWVKNFFLPRMESALNRAERIFERLPAEQAQKHAGNLKLVFGERKSWITVGWLLLSLLVH